MPCRSRLLGKAAACIPHSKPRFGRNRALKLRPGPSTGSTAQTRARGRLRSGTAIRPTASSATQQEGGRKGGSGWMWHPARMGGDSTTAVAGAEAAVGLVGSTAAKPTWGTATAARRTGTAAGTMLKLIPRIA